MPRLLHLRRSLLPLLATCLYLAGQLAGLEHLAAVPHRLCDEHGEAVHAEHGMAFLSGAHREAAPDLHRAAETHEAPHHEHCQVLSHLGQRGLAQEPQTSHLAAPGSGHGPLARQDRTHPAITPRQLAPKHSPPAA